MNRQKLLQLLNGYEADTAEEQGMKTELTAFVRQHEDCFERTLLVGHVTGSAWVLDKTRTLVLLMHHRKLDRWFQPGGHCDGNPDVQEVAQREAWEETGVVVKPVSEAIFDVDIHTIPARGQEPEHLHYDVRFLFEADATQPIVINQESKDIRWVPLADVTTLNDEESIARMVRKTGRL
ncbi:NUDIX hydrolase [Siphonobacter sp. BAB-5385]|uniref:NUDIX hydrolase n=1 Tax=Siphonobacter sp. BAB-5385 TaxID=1864822 RepID=UPI000B9E480A|nr:NUDIX hydrolase [Siphonobacter sp. BAB-5385]OZI06649.1 NUDIX hydrolase [Siphonobacter sp. BAB-5385]